ncbi:MAG: hypothetical protein QY322_02165 [bacterium]|nr:MAG: hypothetical protein QY322_02165 [bacterium]
MADPLDKIFTPDREVDSQLLSDILFPFVKINSEDLSIFFTNLGNKLPINKKLIIFLLAKKALYIKGKVELESVTPNDIIDQTDLKSGSVHPGLKQLRDKNLVIVKDGRYFIPNYQINEMKNLFLEGK